MTMKTICLALVASALLCSACAEKKTPPPEKVEARVEVTVRSVPPGAAVLLTGRDRLGETPLILRRRPGERVRLHFAKEGYQPAIRNLFVEGKKKQTLRVRLRKETGTLIVDTGLIRGAKVLLDGSYRGRSPLRVELTVGEHLLRVEKPGAIPFEKRVRIEKPGQQLRVPVRVTPLDKNKKKRKGKRRR